MEAPSLPHDTLRTANESSARRFFGPLVLWLLIMTTMASFRHRHASELWEGSGIDAQVKFQLAVWFGLGCLALYLLWSGRADLRLLRRGPLFWYGLYATWALVSTLYSVAPSLTIYRSLQIGVALVLVISMREHLRSLYALVIVYIAANWVLFLLALTGLDGGQGWIRGPDDAFVYWSGTPDMPWRFATAFGHPSQISAVAGAAAVGLAARTRRDQWLRWAPIIGWLALTTVLTVSRTAIAGMLGGLLVVAIGRRVWVPALLAAGLLIPLALTSDAVQEKATRYLMRGQTVGQFASLTGRDEIYSQAFEQAEQAWPWGMGFQAGRRQLLEEGGLGGITHAHNVLLESTTSLGVVGLVLAGLLLLTLGTTLWRLLDRPPPDEPSAVWELAGMFVPVLAFCIMDRGFATAVDPFLLFFLVMAARTMQVQRQSHVAIDQRERQAVYRHEAVLQGARLQGARLQAGRLQAGRLKGDGRISHG